MSSVKPTVKITLKPLCLLATHSLHRDLHRDVHRARVGCVVTQLLKLTALRLVHSAFRGNTVHRRQGGAGGTGEADVRIWDMTGGRGVEHREGLRGSRRAVVRRA